MLMKACCPSLLLKRVHRVQPVRSQTPKNSFKTGRTTEELLAEVNELTKNGELLHWPDQETKKELKDFYNVQGITSHRAQIDKENKPILDAYKKLYADIHKDGATWQNPWHYTFYDLPAEEQQALNDWKFKSQELYFKVANQYDGNKSARALGTIGSVKAAVEAPSGEPVRVAITGAGGQIGYALAFRIASGGLFGPSTPVILHLLELPQAEGMLKGLVMELNDCAFPTLAGIKATTKAEEAFEGIDWALLVGAQPRTQGMERGDLLLKNAQIFAHQGGALNKYGKGKDTRVVVVGNPANTNALIAQQNAPNIPPENFSAMTRLDHNRGLSQIASNVGCNVKDIERFIIWGNHSATQFPDVAHTLIKGQLATEVLDEQWVTKTFIPAVQKRGAAIIEARGSSSAQSAASSLIDSVHDWHFGSALQWTSAAVYSSGEYGITPGLFYSYPVIYNSLKQWGIVKNLPIDEVAAVLMEKTHQELLQERDGVAKYLPKVDLGEVNAQVGGGGDGKLL